MLLMDDLHQSVPIFMSIVFGQDCPANCQFGPTSISNETSEGQNHDLQHSASLVLGKIGPQFCPTIVQFTWLENLKILKFGGLNIEGAECMMVWKSEGQVCKYAQSGNLGQFCILFLLLSNSQSLYCVAAREKGSRKIKVLFLQFLIKNVSHQLLLSWFAVVRKLYKLNNAFHGWEIW